MSAIDTLEKIAALLPEKQKQRFLLLSSRFRNVPEDDEYLQILEAIGFMTLLWNEVPNEIDTLLKKASPVDTTQQQLKTMITDTVKSAVPSYEDLRVVCERLEQHELVLKRITSDKRGTKPRVSWFSWLLLFGGGLLAGHFLPAIIANLSAFMS